MTRNKEIHPILSRIEMNYRIKNAEDILKRDTNDFQTIHICDGQNVPMQLLHVPHVF